MNIVDMLNQDLIICNPDTSSKKRVMELLSQTLSDEYADLTAAQLFNSFNSREKLGSTALGNGVAIPHGRCEKIDKATMAMMKLSKGIDYDAPDSEPVDLLVGLAVPEEATEEHLEILATLAEMLSDKKLVTRLRRANSSQSMLSSLKKWAESKYDSEATSTETNKE